jgi:hypothetical protein
MCVMLAGVATSQTTTPSQGYNDQLNVSGMFADQTLNVVTVDEGVSAATTAVGNHYGVTVNGADAGLTSNQVNQGEVSAHGVVNVSDALGDRSNVMTLAVGNNGEATAAYGTLSGVMVQTNSGAVTARSQIEGETAQAGDVAETSVAAGNSQGVLLVNGSTGARISQNNQADVAADGGAIVQYVSGASNVTGTAAGNTIDLTGVNGSAARIITDQNNGAANVTATKFTAYGNSYLTTTTAVASGNALSAANSGTLLDVASHQYNTAYVRAQAEESSYDFGGAQATAYGVGNTATASNSNGPGLVLDNVQVNDGGGVEVMASFEGNGGYDAGASATAVGNSVSGAVCNQCGGNLTATNSQANNVDVSARSTVSVAAGARSVIGVSNATGNSATFSVNNSGY